MADVDISSNPNPFNFWTDGYEYINKKWNTNTFFSKLKESVNPIISRLLDTMRIHLFGQNPYEFIYGLESEYISFFAIEYEYNYPLRDMDLSPC